MNELRSDFSRPDRPVVAAEFVATSISSGGDGAAALSERTRTQLSENPHIKWHENRRGYISCTIDRSQWLSEFRSVGYVSKPGAPIETASRWRAQHGRPGVERL